jgi:hypothetical protein
MSDLTIPGLGIVERWACALSGPYREARNTWHTSCREHTSGSLQRWMCGCAQELPGLCCFDERVERVQESMLQDSRQLIQDDVQASRALVKIEIRREEESATETDA